MGGFTSSRTSVAVMDSVADKNVVSGSTYHVPLLCLPLFFFFSIYTKKKGICCRNTVTLFFFLGIAAHMKQTVNLTQHQHALLIYSHDTWKSAHSYHDRPGWARLDP